MTEGSGTAVARTHRGEGRPRTDGAEAEREEVPDTETEDMDTELEFGSSKCICTECGHTEAHADRGIPCSKQSCPKCGAPMKGLLCEGRSE